MHAWESIQKVVDYIEDNLQENNTPEELSKVAMLSPFYFQRLFTRLVKRPVNEYIKMRRLAKACEVLGDKSRRILDIALDYGFNSHEYFTKTFKSAFSITPDEYRNHPVPLNQVTKPDLLLGYVHIDEDVPLISKGIVLEINRNTLDEPIHFIGFSGHVSITGHVPGGNVTGIDEPGAIWERFHESDIPMLIDWRNIGISCKGDAPEGCFTYFAGTEAAPGADSGGYATRQLPSGNYIVCTFEAEDFEALVTDAIYKAGDYTESWLKKKGLTRGNFMAELYTPCNSSFAIMEMWYPIIEINEEGKI
ncbi:MAG: AraC family transcriptional regulator [Defluviitaleaceae bacterium]|nr:AraC family transcriptional regulator [Defluviitaleaceae bacterium]